MNPGDFSDEVIADIVRLRTAAEGAQSVPNGNVPYVMVPEGYKVQAVPELIYNEHTATPERIKQRVVVLDAPSFCRYYALFGDQNSRTFADETALKVVSVLDYHAAGEGTPRWGQHQLTLELRKSEEWKVWLGSNNKHLGQQDFAEFLEQNSLDITKPSPAAIMEVANDLQAKTEVEFGAGLRQSDGQVKFRYSETTKSTVGSGEIAVPERFTIEIPAFIGGIRVPMEALLRFRVNGGKLVFWYTLVRPEEVIRNAFIASREAIASELSIQIINGTM